MNTEKTLTPHQEYFIRDTVAKWCEERFPQMTECDFVQICEVKHQFHFKMMLDNTHLGKRSSEWQVPKSLIKAAAKRNFEQMAQAYKDAGEVDECGVDRLGESDGTLSHALSDLHYCSDTFWVNPKYANKKVSSLGGIGSRVIAEDGKTSVCLWVYYLEKDGTVIAWDMDVD